MKSICPKASVNNSSDISFRLEVGKNQRPFSQECKSRNNECGDSKPKTIDLTESFDQIFKEDLGMQLIYRPVG